MIKQLRAKISFGRNYEDKYNVLFLSMICDRFLI